MYSFSFASATGVEVDTTSLPPLILEQMAAGAFRSLCQHLAARSDQVANIDIMAVGGFCRNCLSKWMVLEARALSNSLRDDANFASMFSGSTEETPSIIKTLDAMGYDEAAQEVYGCTYQDWKKRHQKKSSDEQLRRYKESEIIHAKHDADLLGVKGTIADVNLNDCQKNLSQKVLVRLQAGAFLSLCKHLRERSDAVQNIELMTIGGFCRNCLAKWLVVEARKISSEISANAVVSSYFYDQQQSVIEDLDAFGYDEAALLVYGGTYPEWKKLHQKKATDEQMERYNGSVAIHAVHNKELLAVRSKGSSSRQSVESKVNDTNSKAPIVCLKQPAQKQSLLSDVCCEDVDNLNGTTIPAAVNTSNSRKALKPPSGSISLKIAILTVSDRAASGSYETGDLSGPAVEKAITNYVEQINSSFNDQNTTISHLKKAIVADEIDDIKQTLLRWSENEAYDMVFTTGGTGFATRDNTPEATLMVLDRECQGLMSWASMELTSVQPLATLSRAAAGVCGNTLIINLPGNPSGASQVVELMFPLLLHAVHDLRGGR
eukprot:g10355.t1 g10355   contig4:1709650-1711696(+)